MARANDPAPAWRPRPRDGTAAHRRRRTCWHTSAVAWILAVAGLPASAANAGSATKPIREAIDAADNACLTPDALAAGLAFQGLTTVDGRVTVHVRESEDAFEYWLSPDGSPQQKEVPGEACSVKVYTASVAIALALDKVRLPPEPVCDQPAGGSPPPKVVPVTPRAREQGATSLEAVSLIGVLPAITAGIAPRLSIEVDPLVDVSVSGLVSLPVVSALGPGRIETGLVAGGFDACMKQVLGAGLVRGCLGVAGGGMPASGQGFGANRSWVGPWAAFASRFDARWTLIARFGIAASVEVLVPVVRPRFEVGGVPGQVLLSPVGVGLGLGPSIVF